MIKFECHGSDDDFLISLFPPPSCEVNKRAYCLSLAFQLSVNYVLLCSVEAGVARGDTITIIY